MKLYNTLSRQLESLITIKPKTVAFYHCGPTVYSHQHIGNLRGMLMGDLVRRTLEYLNYQVNYVRNYTDVGHLVSDADEGEDKMAKAARRDNKKPEEIADKYIKQFEKDTKALNLLEPTYKPRASDYIEKMQEMIKILLEKGYAYQTELAIYFDTAKFKNYNRLSHQELSSQKEGAGKAIVEDKAKKRSQDFALWFFKKGKHAQALQTWDSPWGRGFPGWHLECSVMSKALLGDTIDVHMGGVEHIPIHHTNEIAQSEAANGVKFVNYWLHNEHLLVNGQKMAKSEGKAYLLKDITSKGFQAMDLRYLFLQAHYRSQQNFTWQALESAREARLNLLWALYDNGQISAKGKIITSSKQRFTEAIKNDVNTPQALAILWELINSSEEKKDIIATALDFDKVFGLRLKESLEVTIPQKIERLGQERWRLRQEGQYKEADDVRKKIDSEGYLIEDNKSNYSIKPKVF